MYSMGFDWQLRYLDIYLFYIIADQRLRMRATICVQIERAHRVQSSVRMRDGPQVI